MSTLPAIDTASALETLLKSDKVHLNLHSGVLVEHAVRRSEGLLADNGAMVGYTGKYTGRTP
ncbi:MAG TPA: phosphoenolpyruvate carboxykinase (ATP), partial [Candidatus Limnocylindrales bacterium]|nr:phosphoenolpyruvate carboxykinase (ATP) [Candidatus Limnocylindrales bacterium]